MTQNIYYFGVPDGIITLYDMHQLYLLSVKYNKEENITDVMRWDKLETFIQHIKKQKEVKDNGMVEIIICKNGKIISQKYAKHNLL